jgi:hypothetical protein
VQSGTSRAVSLRQTDPKERHRIFELIATMRGGSAGEIAAACARYETIEAARIGTATLFRDDRVLRAMTCATKFRRVRGMG